MQYIFYICILITILTTVLVIIQTNPINALMYLIISLISISGIFFSIGSYFAGALEIIIYAGAIMVLFIFVIMFLNLGKKTIKQEKKWIFSYFWTFFSFITAFFLFLMFFYGIQNSNFKNVKNNIITIKEIGFSLFDKYILIVEFSSLILLCGIIVANHINKNNLK